MKKFRNKSMLFLMGTIVEIAASSTSQPSTMQNIYSGVATRLTQAKNAAANLLFSNATNTVNVPKGITLYQASLLVQQLINNKPKDDADLNTYWKVKSSLFLSCAKLLPDETEKQILKALQEIDRRLLYWLYQQEHQWQYFFSKNPLKWVMGKKQEVEIETNIEQLQSKQDELFTRLGELSAIDWHQYLVAMNNYQAAYAWIEKLLNIVSGIKQESAAVVSSDNYDAIVKKLNEELKKVGVYASTILSSLEATAMPYHITRNWVKYGALMMAGRWAYNNPDIVADFATLVSKKGTQFQATLEEHIGAAKKYINETFFGVRGDKRLIDAVGKGVIVHKATEEEVGIALEKFLDRASAEGLIWSGPLAVGEKKNILDAFKAHNPGPYQKFFNELMVSPFKNNSYIVEATSLFAQVLHVCTGVSIEQGLITILDQVEGSRNLALLAPAAIGVGVGTYGLSKVYGRLTTYDYSPIRLALVAISSLFVDTTKPLDDLDYGKMIFLLYNLKEKAKRELPVKNNVRNDFIKDLERVESREFDSAAKRRIIKDMFKKYSFLGLVQ